MVKKMKASSFAWSCCCAAVTGLRLEEGPLPELVTGELELEGESRPGVDGDVDSAWRLAACGLATSAARSLSRLGILGGARTAVLRFRRHVVTARLAAGLGAHAGADSAQQTLLAREAYTFAALSLLWLLRLPSQREAGLQRLVDVATDADTRAYIAALAAQLAGGARQAPHAIVTSGHVGFWEILPAALARPLVPVHTQWVVYRPLHDAGLDELLGSIRQAPGRRLIADKHCFTLLRDALQRPNVDGSTAQLVGLVADQRCNNPAARAQVTFLGQRTYFPTGAARLHLETGASLWFAVVLHNPRFYETSDPAEKPFRLVLRAISTDGTKSGLDTTALVQSYASVLEQVVLEHPEQYLWMHQLWKEPATLHID